MADKVAGETPLLNVFRDGTIVVLYSKASGKTLRILHDDKVEGNGGEGTLAQFIVHVRREGVLCLQNVNNPEHWLKIKDNETSGLGRGHEFCEFKVAEFDDCVVFESVCFPGQHVGIRPDGDVKPSNLTGTGLHARFTPKVIKEREELNVPGRSCLQTKFAHGNIIVLESQSSGKTLRIHTGEVQGLGGRGTLAQFIVHVRGNNVVSLQNVGDRNCWLKIKNDQLTGNGKGGQYTEFKIEEHDGFVVLGSVCFPDQHVGIRPDGDVKPPNRTGTGLHARFTVEVIKEQPEWNRAGDSFAMRTLAHGNRIILYSKASEKTLRFIHGNVEGHGGEGGHAQFTVHVRQPGVIALQNVAEPKKWLKIVPNELKAGTGGRKCELKVEEHDGYLVFESVQNSDLHVGIRPNGDAKPPNETGTGQHARFTPKVKHTSPFLAFIAGRGDLQRLFMEGETVILESHSSGKTLRIRDGEVQGSGGRGALAQFKVWIRAPGVAALQNKDDWIAIRENKLTTGRGGLYTNLIVEEVDGFVVLESHVHKGQHVGIYPDGEVKPPNETGTGKHARFTPTLLD